MQENLRKEQFSRAYVRAVAAVCGFAIFESQVDDDSIDLIIAARGEYRTCHSPKLDVQVKCTARDVIRDGHLAVPLSIKNYEDLRARRATPIVLVVVIVPDNDLEWLEQSEEQMVMRRCGYWMSLATQPDVPNQESVTVHVPRSQVFSVQQLSGIMHDIGNGGNS